MRWHAHYTLFINLTDHAIDAGFVRLQHRSIFVVDDDPARLLTKTLALPEPDTTVGKW